MYSLRDRLKLLCCKWRLREGKGLTEGHILFIGQNQLRASGFERRYPPPRDSVFSMKETWDHQQFLFNFQASYFPG